MNTLIDMSHGFIYILWWVGCYGLIESIINQFRLNNYARIKVYLFIIFLAFVLMHTNNIPFK